MSVTCNKPTATIHTSIKFYYLTICNGFFLGWQNLIGSVWKKKSKSDNSNFIDWSMVSFTLESTYFIINIFNSTLKEDKISGVYSNLSEGGV